MASPVVGAFYHIEENNEVNYNTRHHVGSVEASNKKEIICELRQTILVIRHVGTIKDFPHVFSFCNVPHIAHRAVLGAHDKVVPLPGLRPYESEAADDG